LIGLTPNNCANQIKIEGCDNCIIKLNGRIRTEMVEIWRSNNCTLIVNAKVKTIQADLCENLTINYASRANFDQLIWAGVNGFHLSVGEDKLESGIAKYKDSVQDFKENFDQFIVRYISGVLTEELVVRLDNGFPTTDREADEFDRVKEKNDKLFEDHVRKLLSVSTIWFPIIHNNPCSNLDLD